MSIEFCRFTLGTFFKSLNILKPIKSGFIQTQIYSFDDKFESVEDESREAFFLPFNQLKGPDNA